MILRIFKGLFTTIIAIAAVLFLVSLCSPTTKKDAELKPFPQVKGGNPVFVSSPTEFVHYFIVNKENLTDPVILKQVFERQCEGFRQNVCVIQFWQNAKEVPTVKPDDMANKQLNSRAGVFWLNEKTKFNRLTLEQNGKDIGQY